ncbi:protein GVQW3-like [Adelges cooleyi]|uniref:protein GVQW3-like n=1 Tax=Adelges cooleyi TaxID=133065 RepID=UPI0021802148|nr:protein GVQW3-like [Adelges cooleyi]
MATYLERGSDCEVRSVMKFLTWEGVAACEIHRRVTSAYGENVMSIQMVRRWRKTFEEGRVSVHDEHCSGRLSSPSHEDAVEAVRAILDKDRRRTLDQILELVHPKFELTRSVVGLIVQDDLNLNKVCARWVPRLLSDEHKQNRLDAENQFFEMLEDEGEGLYARIVTGHETWIHHNTPETKMQSMV